MQSKPIQPASILSGILLIFHIPTWIYKMQYGIEQANDIKLLSAALGIGFSFILIWITLLISSKSQKTIHSIRLITTILLCFTAFLDMFLNDNQWKFSIGFCMLWWTGFSLLNEWQNAISEVQLKLWMGIVGGLILSGAIFFQWLNFIWYPPRLWVIFNILMIIGIGTFELITKKSAKKAENTQAYIEERNQRIKENIPITYIIRILIMGITTGAIISLYKLSSENFPVSSQTHIITIASFSGFIGILIYLAYYFSPKIKYNSFFQIKITVTTIILIGLPWYLGTNDLITNSTTGIFHTIGIFWVWYLFFIFGNGIVITNKTMKISIIQAILFSLGFIIGIAGYLMGGTNYRVDPEIGLIFTSVLLIGIYTIPKQIMKGEINEK
jgi:MFS family permease